MMMLMGQHDIAPRRLMMAMAVILLTGASARADRLVLFDGREITGQILSETNIVTIRTAAGELSVRQQDISSIERTPSADDRSASFGLGADALFAMSAWASQHGLADLAGELHKRVLEIDTDHRGVRTALGQVHVNGRWMSFKEAVAIVADRIAAGEHGPIAATWLDGLRLAADAGEQIRVVDLLGAHLSLRRGRFGEAGAGFAKLARTAAPGAKPRLTAIAALLADHPDGAYVLTVERVVSASLDGARRRVIGAGPASLADPAVLDAALEDLACELLTAGADVLDEARRLRVNTPAAADAACLKAIEWFDRADALAEGIARFHRIEAARVQVAVIRDRTERDAVAFDAELSAMGAQEVTAAEYAARIVRMVDYLNSVRGDLAGVLRLAGAYPDELALDIRWARDDIERIKRMQATLKQELDDSQ